MTTRTIITRLFARCIRAACAGEPGVVLTPAEFSRRGDIVRELGVELQSAPLLRRSQRQLLSNWVGEVKRAVKEIRAVSTKFGLPCSVPTALDEEKVVLDRAMKETDNWLCCLTDLYDATECEIGEKLNWIRAGPDRVSTAERTLAAFDAKLDELRKERSGLRGLSEYERGEFERIFAAEAFALVGHGQLEPPQTKRLALMALASPPLNKEASEAHAVFEALGRRRELDTEIADTAKRRAEWARELAALKRQQTWDRPVARNLELLKERLHGSRMRLEENHRPVKRRVLDVVPSVLRNTVSIDARTPWALFGGASRQEAGNDNPRAELLRWMSCKEGVAMKERLLGHLQRATGGGKRPTKLWVMSSRGSMYIQDTHTPIAKVGCDTETLVDLFDAMGVSVTHRPPRGRWVLSMAE